MRISWIVLLFSLILVFAIVVNSESPSRPLSEFNLQDQKETLMINRSQFTVSEEPLVIQGNEGFEQAGWSGSGTQADPYLLSNVNLITNSTSISILNTNAYFVIENVTLSSADTLDDLNAITGIALQNVRNGIIRNAIIQKMGRGISFGFSSNFEFRNITFEDVDVSISVQTSYNFKIKNSNTTRIIIWNSRNFNISSSVIRSWGLHIENSRYFQIYNSSIKGFQDEYGDTGLYMYSSHHVIINQTSFDVHITAIAIFSSDDVVVTNTYITESSIAFYLSRNVNCNITDTAISEGTIHIVSIDERGPRYNFDNVTIDDKLVGYFEGVHDLSLNETGYSYLFLLNVENVEIWNKNNTITLFQLSILGSNSVSIKDISVNYIRLDTSESVSMIDVTANIIEIYSSNTTSIIDSIVNEALSGWDSFNIQLLNLKAGRITIGSNSGNVTVIGCLLVDLSIYNSRGVSISSSTITTAYEYGISLGNTEQITLRDVQIYGTGIRITGNDILHFIHVFINITINGKALGYFYSQREMNIDPSEFSQLILVNCNDISIESASLSDENIPFSFVYCSNIQVRNLSLTNISGIAFSVYSSQVIIFDDVSIYDGSDGLSIERSDEVSLTNCNFVMDGRGIYVYDSSNVRISNTSIISWNGIEIFDSALIALTENNITTTDVGILLYYFVDIDIIGNRINAGAEGIGIHYSSFWEQDLELVDIIANTFIHCFIGIRIEFSYNVHVIGNRILSSTMNGINLLETYDSTFLYNEIAYSKGTGVLFEESSNNLVYGNLFHHNDIEHVRETAENVWQSSDGVGNYYDDYSGNGTYQINGDTNTYDMNPLSISGDNFTLPLLTNPPDKYVRNSNNQTLLTWVIWLEHPVEYFIYLDSVEIERGSIEISGKVSVLIDELAQGFHNFTLLINTSNGIYKVDQVMILIDTIIPGGYLTLVTISLILGTVVVLELKRRKDLP
ncbi:MAG: right-handed parallel beta-helix repeat-containing protein [Candidatus Thorarchaeota archaeon]